MESNATVDLIQSNATHEAHQKYDAETIFRYYNDPWFVFRPRATGFKCFWMCCGCLSTVACYVVLREALQNVSTRGPHRNRAVPYQHATMAVAYGIYSLTQMMGPLPAPSQHDDWGPVGSIGTCSAQGFVLTLSLVAASITNASIILQYMLIVRYNWSDDKLLRLLKKINVCALLLSLFMAISPLTYDGYNYGKYTCLLASLPVQCCGDEEVDCLRGPCRSHAFRIVVSNLDLAIHATCLLSVMVNFCLAFLAVKSVEDRISQYSFRGMKTSSSSIHATVVAPVPVNRAKSLAVFREARLYCLLFGSVLLAYVLYLYVVDDYRFYYLYNSLIVLQGFFISLIFMQRGPNMKTPEGRVFRSFVWFVCACEPIRTRVIEPLSAAFERSRELRKHKRRSNPDQSNSDTTEFHHTGTSTSRMCEDLTIRSSHPHGVNPLDPGSASAGLEEDTDHDPTDKPTSPNESGNRPTGAASRSVILLKRGNTEEEKAEIDASDERDQNSADATDYNSDGSTSRLYEDPTVRSNHPENEPSGSTFLKEEEEAHLDLKYEASSTREASTCHDGNNSHYDLAKTASDHAVSSPVAHIEQGKEEMDETTGPVPPFWI